MANTPRDQKGIIHWLRNFLCGTLIGGGAVLPGVSGGVLAVIFGIYQPFMEMLTRPRTALPKYWRYCIPLAFGWALGFLCFAKGIAAALRLSDTVTTWLFIGLVIGTIPALFREAGQEGRPAAAWASLFICACGVLAGLFYMRHSIDVTVEPNFWWYNFCGVLWGIGVVIPGLTFSSVIMALGLYQPILEGLARLDPQVLSASFPGMILTILLLSRVATWFLRKHHSVALHGILGIAVASTLVIVPTQYAPGEGILSFLFGTGGFLLAFFLARLDQTFER